MQKLTGIRLPEFFEQLLAHSFLCNFELRAEMLPPVLAKDLLRVQDALLALPGTFARELCLKIVLEQATI